VIATVRMRRGKAADSRGARSSSVRRWPPPSRRAAPAPGSCERTRSSTTPG
jgi:hypothetical protein